MLNRNNSGELGALFRNCRFGVATVRLGGYSNSAEWLFLKVNRSQFGEHGNLFFGIGVFSFSGSILRKPVRWVGYF